MKDDEKKTGRHVRIRDLDLVRNAPTMMECPWCCGAGLVTPAKLAEWQAKYPEIKPPRTP